MGCLRPWVPRLIWFLTLFIVAAIIWGTVYYPEAMWAPGHISRFHGDISECQGCHEPFRGTTSRKCIVCHTEQMFQEREESELGRWHQEIIRQAQSCKLCHMEHLGIQAFPTIGLLENPHGGFIFRVTGTSTCFDCHYVNPDKGTMISGLLDNSRVQHLREEGEGAHQAGRFAECLHCHRRRQLEMEKE